jgi:glutamate synthase (NADPH/NADH) small chain
MGYDAVFVAAGAGAPAFLGIPGEFAGQVYSANEFLTRVNLMGGDRFPYRHAGHAWAAVVVIGAGNTAMDCLRVAKRLGVPHGALRLPPLRGRGAGAHGGAAPRQGRGHRVHASCTRRSRSCTMRAATCAACACRRCAGRARRAGRRKPCRLDEFVDWCDTVIYALGTKANPIVGSPPRAGVSTSGATSWPTRCTQATSDAGVFAGGDIVTGGATVILAMGAGRRAARSIGASSGRSRRATTTCAARASS